MAHNHDHQEAITDAAILGSEPVAYTVIEGEEWQPAPIVGDRVHSIWFSSGDQWDEINAWRRGPMRFYDPERRNFD